MTPVKIKTDPAPKAKRKYNYKVKPGRPTDYKPEYCQMVIDFFKNYQIRSARTFTSDIQGVAPKVEVVTNDYPTLTDFATKININRTSFHVWSTKYPDFFDALQQAKQLQNEIIIKGALSGHYNASFAIFAMKNIAGWRDKHEMEHSGSVSWEGLVNDLSGAETKNTRQLQGISNN